MGWESEASGIQVIWHLNEENSKNVSGKGGKTIVLSDIIKTSLNLDAKLSVKNGY